MRLAARAIDAVIMIGAYWLLEALDVAPPAHYSSLVTGDTLDTGIASLLRASVVIPLITLAIWLVLEVVPTAARGRTIGKLIVGLKVVRADTWRQPGVGKSLGRWVVPAVPFVVIPFGILVTALVYASAAWNKQGQGWHDKAAGTVVVRARRRDRPHPAGVQAESTDSAAPSAVGPQQEGTAASIPPPTLEPLADRVVDDEAAVQAAGADAGFGRVITGTTTLKSGKVVQLASPGRRLAARAVDWAIGALAWIVISVLSEPSVPSGDPLTSFFRGFEIGAVIVLGLGACYEIAMIAFRGQTIGKAVAGARVVRADDGMDPGAMRAGLRWLVVAAPRVPPVLALTLGGPALSSAAGQLVWVLWPLVYVSLLWGRDHRGWHDMVAGTLVVREQETLLSGPHRTGRPSPGRPA